MEEEKSLVDRLLDKETDFIDITTPLEVCVNNFFIPFVETNQSYQQYKKSSKRTKYFLMKRFLYTAYNSLLAIDLSITSSRMLTVKKNLEFVEKHYIDFKHQISKPPELKYEDIFLAKQKQYVEVYKAASQKKKVSEAYKAKAKSIDSKMDEIRVEIKQYEKNSDEYAKLFHSFKRLNTQSTDLYYKSSKLKEQVIILLEFLKLFKDKFLEPFKDLYIERGKLILEDVVDILDSIGYEFDKTLWEEAKKSPAVEKYFKNSNISGELSSVTYLKYYLKTLDKSKSNQTNKELDELVKYLEQFGCKDLILVGSDHGKLNETKQLIHSFEKNYNIYIATDLQQFTKIQDTKQSDLLIFLNIKKKLMVDIIKELRKYDDMQILSLLENPSFEQIDFIGKIGISNILVEKHDEDNMLLSRIRKILS